MDDNEKLSAFDTSMETYFKAVKAYEKGESFTPRSLAERFYSGERKYVIRGYTDTMDTHLRHLNKYGIVDWYGRSHFAIKLKPDDPEEDWKEELGKRGGLLYSTIQRIKGSGEAPIETIEEEEEEVTEREIIPIKIGHTIKGADIYAEKIIESLEEPSNIKRRVRFHYVPNYEDESENDKRREVIDKVIDLLNRSRGVNYKFTKESDEVDDYLKEYREFAKVTYYRIEEIE